MRKFLYRQTQTNRKQMTNKQATSTNNGTFFRSYTKLCLKADFQLSLM